MVDEENKVIFIDVMSVFHAKDGKKKWIHIYVRAIDEDDALIAKEQLTKGQKAINILSKMEEYYKEQK